MKQEFEAEGYHEANTPVSAHRCGCKIVEALAEDDEFVLVCHADRLYWQTGLKDHKGKSSVAVRKMRQTADRRYAAGAPAPTAEPVMAAETKAAPQRTCTHCGRTEVEWYPSGGQWCKACRQKYDRERMRRKRAA